MPKLPQPVTIDRQPYLYLSPQHCHELALTLALKLQQDIQEGKLAKPDLILGIARGAMTFTKTVADWLNLDRIATIRVVHYTEIGKRLKKPTLLQSNLPQVINQRVLLLDNVVETGKTLKLATDYVTMCGTDTLTTGVLFAKNGSIINPDYYAAHTKAWIIFYFDLVETIKMLGSRWLSQGHSVKTLHYRFTTIGIPEYEVTQALTLLFNYE